MSSKTYKRLGFNVLIIFSFAIFSLLSVSIMVHAHFIAGGIDSTFHFKRILELKYALMHHDIPQFGLNYFRGSAVMTFYPYLNLYPIIFLSTLIKSKVMLCYASIVFYVFISFLTSFYGSKKVSQSWRVSYLFSLFYILANMYMYYGLGSMDLGVLASLTWMPLVIFGFIRLMDTKTEWLELSMGLTLIIFSHVLTSLILIILLMFWTLFNFHQIHLLTLFSIFKAFIFTSLTTSVVWVPAFLMEKYNNVIPPDSVKVFGSPISSIMRDDWNSYGMGMIDIVGLFLVFILYKEFKPMERQLYIIALVSIFVSSSFFPWYHLPNILAKYLNLFQYSSRFLIIPQIALAYLTSVGVMKFIHTVKIRNLILVLFAFLMLGLQFQNQCFLVRNNQNKQVVNNNFIKRHTVGKYPLYTFATPMEHRKNPNPFEHTPSYKITSDRSFNQLVNPNTFMYRKDYTLDTKYSGLVQNHKAFIHLKKSQSTISNIKHNGYNHFEFTNHKAGLITLPTFYFKRERLRVYLDGQQMPISHDHGLIRMNTRIPKGHHQLQIKELPSFEIKTAKLWSLIGLMGYLIEILLWLFGRCRNLITEKQRSI